MIGSALDGYSAKGAALGAAIGGLPRFLRYIKNWGPFSQYKNKQEARKAAIDYVNNLRKENAETRELADRLDSFSRPRFPYYR